MKLRMKHVLVAIGASAVCISIACIDLVERGVHFKGVRIDFGAPPVRYAMHYATFESDRPAWRPGTLYYNDEADRLHLYDGKASATAREVRQIERIYNSAQRLEQAGNYVAARRVWKHCVHVGVGDPSTNRRRLLLMDLLAAHHQLPHAKALLSATQPVRPSHSLPEPNALPLLLRPFALYARAERHESAREYFALAREFPASALAEPALIMVPRILLRADKVPAGDIERAGEALDRLATAYPRSRFRADVVGWRGRICYLQGHYRDALRQYRRQFELCQLEAALHGPLESQILCEQRLGHRPLIAAAYLLRYGQVKDSMVRFQAITHLTNTFDEFSGNDAKAFWGIIRAEPRLLTYYLDFRVDGTKPTADLLAMAGKCGAPTVNSIYGGHFLGRLAEAAYLLHRNDLAHRYALDSLARSRTIDDRGRANFLLGSLARRSGQYALAIRRYEAIVRDSPTSFLVDGARENLALLYERKGRWGQALDLYQQLGCNYDVAYLLDIRMTPDQIARYMATRRQASNRTLLKFSLGMRRLRQHDWEGAIATFRSLTASQRSRLIRKPEYSWWESAKQQDPLKSSLDLARLDRRIRNAGGSLSKAQAMMAMADYYYDHRNLLLYNARLWEGSRSSVIGDSWNWRVATKQDERALDTHHWEHECLAQSLLLCRQIVKRYPRVAVRYRAAYRGACAANRLAVFNPYWRWRDDKVDLEKEAVHLMKMARGAPDRVIAKKANKYWRVFTAQRDENRQAFEHERVPRHWGDYSDIIAER